MSDKAPGLRTPSVIVTGHAKNGESIVLPSKSLNWVSGDNGHQSKAEIYTQNETPIDFQDDKVLTNNHPIDLDLSTKVIGSGKLGLVHPDGAVVRFFDVAPNNPVHFHQTLSVDFSVCVEGRMELRLDSGESRIMERGDMVIQRGTKHTWQNPSETEWARLMAVMLPAKEFYVGDKLIENDVGFYANS